MWKGHGRGHSGAVGVHDFAMALANENNDSLASACSDVTIVG